LFAAKSGTNRAVLTGALAVVPDWDWRGAATARVFASSLADGTYNRATGEPISLATPNPAARRTAAMKSLRDALTANLEI
jgi:hypothetical protein